MAPFGIGISFWMFNAVQWPDSDQSGPLIPGVLFFALIIYSLSLSSSVFLIMDFLLVAAYAGAALLAAIIANVVSQLLFPQKNKPPLVFHWIPFLGNTLSYGLDPYTFFFSCRKEVRCPSSPIIQPANSQSTATSSPSSSSARRPPSTWVCKATTSS